MAALTQPSRSETGPHAAQSTLYVAAAGDRGEHMRCVLGDAGIEFREPYPGILGIDLLPSTLERLGLELGHCVGATGLQELPALILDQGAGPTIVDLARMQPLGALLAAAQRGWLTEVITKGRLTSYFQPIVNMEHPDQIYAYECLLRGRQADGRLISPGIIFDRARLAGWLTEMDHIARSTALRSAVAHDVTAPLFINMLPIAIATPEHHVATTSREVAAAGIARERVVLEIVETERVQQLHLLQHLVSEYRKAGFRIALDDVGAGYNSLNLLASLKPDLIKLDIELVRDVHRDPFRGQIAAKLIEAARNLGVLTIAEGIETEEEWLWLLSHGAEYGQGFAFAEPVSTPPTARIPHGSYLHGVPSGRSS